MARAGAGAADLPRGVHRRHPLRRVRRVYGTRRLPPAARSRRRLPRLVPRLSRGALLLRGIAAHAGAHRDAPAPPGRAPPHLQPQQRPARRGHLRQVALRRHDRARRRARRARHALLPLHQVGADDSRHRVQPRPRRRGRHQRVQRLPARVRARLRARRHRRRDADLRGRRAAERRHPAGDNGGGRRHHRRHRQHARRRRRRARARRRANHRQLLLGGNWAIPAGFMLLLLVILFRPYGLLGTREHRELRRLL